MHWLVSAISFGSLRASFIRQIVGLLIHMLYATILVSGVSGSLLFCFGHWGKGYLWLLGGLVLSVVAWIAEFSLSRRECGHLRRAKSKVEDALEEIGMWSKTEK